MPLRYPGACRAVYPGFVQLAAFMSMNIDRHMKAHRELYDNLVKGETAEGGQPPRRSTTNISPCSTSPPSSTSRRCELVFQEHAPARTGDADMRRRARSSRARSAAPRCSPSKARSDDICAVGQTRRRTRSLLQSLRPYRKRHHMQAGVGHYGVFCGKTLAAADLSNREERDPAERLAAGSGVLGH